MTATPKASLPVTVVTAMMATTRAAQHQLHIALPVTVTQGHLHAATSFASTALRKKRQRRAATAPCRL
jgi:hypothetical protein